MKTIEQTIEDTLKKYSKVKVDIASEIQDLLYGDKVISRISQIHSILLIERGGALLIYNNKSASYSKDDSEDYLITQLVQHIKYVQIIDKDINEVYNDTRWFNNTKNRLMHNLECSSLYDKFRLMRENKRLYANIAKRQEMSTKDYQKVVEHSLETQIVSNDILDNTISDCKKVMEHEILPKIKDKESITYLNQIIALQKHIIDVHYRLVQEVGIQLNIHQEWIKKYL